MLMEQETLQRQRANGGKERGDSSTQEPADGNDPAQGNDERNISQTGDGDSAQSPQAIHPPVPYNPMRRRNGTRHYQNGHDGPLNPSHRNVDCQVSDDVLRKTGREGGNQGAAE